VEFKNFGRKSQRELFLNDGAHHSVVWVLTLVRLHYAVAGNGRRPVVLEILLRTYFVQQWFNLSDPGVEEALYESLVLQRFFGVDLGAALAPDETSVCRFRHLLEKHDLCGMMLQMVNIHLKAKGIKIAIDTIPVAD
jgi:IS5 family transposase